MVWSRDRTTAVRLSRAIPKTKWTLICVSIRPYFWILLSAGISYLAIVWYMFGCYNARNGSPEDSLAPSRTTLLSHKINNKELRARWNECPTWWLASLSVADLTCGEQFEKVFKRLSKATLTSEQFMSCSQSLGQKVRDLAWHKLTSDPGLLSGIINKSDQITALQQELEDNYGDIELSEFY